jgi:signal peptidase I
MRPRRRTRSAITSLVELVLIVAVAVGLAIGIQAFLVKPYRIPSGSMEPTLVVGERVLVNRIGHAFGPPSVGDIVVFHPPRDFEAGCADPGRGVRGGRSGGQACDIPGSEPSAQNFIKRVVAGPGDRLAIRGGRVILNGRPQDESYIRPCDAGAQCDFPGPITIPPDHFFMMGDNRGASDDSRFWGPVPDEWIIGGAFATYWPIDRIGPL